MKKWKTAISYSSGEKTLIRGYPLEEVIEKLTFTETIFLALKGELPNEKETKIFNAMLSACVDHGIATPSAQSTRIVLSGGNHINAAVAGGVLSLGDYHGGAIENCAKTLKKNIDKNAEEIVKESLEKKKRLAGYGHKVYTTDPRTTKIFNTAKELGLAGKYTTLAFNIEKELEKQKGRKLYLNVDGIIAALLLELGFPPEVGKGFFIIARTPGLVAHAVEEKTTEKPFRRLDSDEWEYIGKEERSI